MTSALRLSAGLAQRSEASAAQIAGASTPDEQLQAHVQHLRSLAALGGRADPEGAALIVKRCAEGVASYIAEMTALLENKIAQMNAARRTTP